MELPGNIDLFLVVTVSFTCLDFPLGVTFFATQITTVFLMGMWNDISFLFRAQKEIFTDFYLLACRLLKLMTLFSPIMIQTKMRAFKKQTL